jgi:hypothetical protein
MLNGREPKEEEIAIPQIHVSFHKVAYVMRSNDMTNVPTKGLTVMDINTLEQNDSKVKSCSEKGKGVEGEDLLQQLIVHTMEETSAKTFV